MKPIKANQEMWEGILERLKEIPPPMLHMYRGLWLGLVYGEAQVKRRSGKFEVELCKDDADMTFSPSFGNPGPVAFYEEPHPPAEDNVTYEFSPMHFLCLCASLDAEAAINYVNVSTLQGEGWLSYYKIAMRSTEGDFPPSSKMPWRNFGDHDPDCDNIFWSWGF